MRDSIAAGSVVGPRLLVSGEFINGWQMSPEAVREEVREQAALGVDYVKLYSGLGPDAVRAGILEFMRMNSLSSGTSSGRRGRRGSMPESTT
ncbi:hypothetical protein BH23BAC4_BH23BAC4_08630 [soil metagenome]